MKLYTDYYDSPIGLIKITATSDAVIGIDFSTVKTISQENSITQEAKKQLIEYFSLKRTCFHLPYQLLGSTFQQKVWKGLLEVPYGQKMCYQDFARMLGSEQAVRAIAHTIGQNPLLIILPCHRIIGKDGSLHGYKAGVSRKQFLLDLEYPQ